MDTVRRRRCETCASHEPGPTPCTGRCRNSAWQPGTDAIRFVRDRELACYQGWGVDHWRPKQPVAVPTDSGATGTGSSGSGSGGSARSYGMLVGSPEISLVPVELLDDAERNPARLQEPVARPTLAD